MIFLKDEKKTAMIHRDREITYRDLLDQATALAETYRIDERDRVVLFAENSPDWIAVFYSIWLRKGIAVPLDYNLPADDLEHILDNCRPSVIWTDPGNRYVAEEACELAGIKPVIRVFPAEAGKPKKRIDEIDIEDPETTAILMYTSGTTGRPKGVMLSYRNLNTSCQAIFSLKMLTREDRMIALLPFYHIFPLQGSVTAPLMVGSTVVFVPALSAEEIIATLQRHPVTMFLGVPRLYELFHNGIMGKMRSNPLALAIFGLSRFIPSLKARRKLFSRVHKAFGGKVHAFLVGGAPMDPKIMSNLRRLGFRMVEGYGATETAPLIAFNPFEKIKKRSVGLPVAGTEVQIKDGEVIVRGKNVMQGYYDNPGATAEAIRDEWYYTGDLGYFDRDGYLYLTGRKDELIVLPNGKNINPEEIENKILKLSAYIREVGVVGLSGHLAAVVYPDFSLLKENRILNSVEAIRKEIMDRYNSGVEAYRKIFTIRVVADEIPRTRLGKIRRFQLMEILTGREAGHKGEMTEPDTGAYLELKGYLASLKDSKIRPGDHLEVDLSLDSLDRVELATWLESRFNLQDGEQILVEYPTVLTLSEYLEGYLADNDARKDRGVDWSSIIQSTGALPLARGNITGGFLIRNILRFVRWFFKTRIEGLEKIPATPVIFTPNHQSYIDALLLTGALPPEIAGKTFFLIKDSRFVNRFVSFFTKGKNMIPVNIERDLKSALQKSAAALSAGYNLVIFPEGVRSRDSRMGRFKKTFAILARELETAIMPVSIQGAYRALPYGSFRPRRHPVSLTFLDPVYPGDESFEELTQRVEDMIRREVETDD